MQKDCPNRKADHVYIRYSLFDSPLALALAFSFIFFLPENNPL